MTRTLDLGCGTNPRNPYNANEIYGLDIVRSDLSNIKQSDLVWESIPFGDYFFDYVTAYDFLEHLPMRVYTPPVEWPNAKGSSRNVMIELFNEVYRVLNDGGRFFIQVPIYPNPQIFQDPTHVSVWTPDTINYFSGDYFGFHDHYGHTSRFEKVSMHIGKPFASHMTVELRAIKNLPVGSEYKLKY